ncbi:MAG: hypothetical protein LBD55_09500 [Treponema sp.]|jgi:hypothetical protein|nr:hypothetical protein [Treponema sp.]
MVLISSCVSASSKPPDQNTNADVPAFVRNPPLQEEEVFGIGGAKTNSVTKSLAAAEQRARQSLTVQLNANVHTMIINYAGARGIPGTKFAEHIEELLTAALLNESIPMKRVKTGDDTFWVLIIYKKTDAAEKVAAIIEREASRYPDFKSMGALKLMEAQLDRIATKPELIDR